MKLTVEKVKEIIEENTPWLADVNDGLVQCELMNQMVIVMRLLEAYALSAEPHEGMAGVDYYIAAKCVSDLRKVVEKLEWEA